MWKLLSCDSEIGIDSLVKLKQINKVSRTCILDIV